MKEGDIVRFKTQTMHPQEGRARVVSIRADNWIRAKELGRDKMHMPSIWLKPGDIVGVEE